MKPKTLSVDLLVTDADTQSRVAINEDTIEEYAELIADASPDWPFGPIDVFHDSTRYLVADGFHRTMAAHLAKRASIPCRVHKGTAVDAKIFGMTANDKHGLRMSRADKRACVGWLLDHCQRLTQAEIAVKAGVSLRLVRYVVAERKAEKVQIAPSGADSAQTANAQFAHSEGNDGGRQETTAQAESGVVTSDSARSSAAQETGFESQAPSKTGEDAGTDSTGTKPQETDPRPPRNGTDKPGDSKDYGKCPNCAGTKWDEDKDGVHCAKCSHPFGEPAGDVDEDRVGIQRAKTLKTVEALMRAFDDLHHLAPKPMEHANSIMQCKCLLTEARAWK